MPASLPSLASPPGLSRLEKAQKATRLLCVMSVFAFASFALVDRVMVDGSLTALYTVRGVVVALALGLFWLSGRPWMARHAYKAGAAITLLTGCGVVVLAGLTGGASSLYWTMVMLTFSTAALIIPFRPAQAGVVFAAIGCFYDVWMLVQGGAADPRGWVLSNAGIWLSAIMSVVAVWFLDELRGREDADRLRLEQLNERLREEAAERAKAVTDLRRAQQLDAAGSLAAGVAHELNNVLLVISGSAELIQYRNGGPDRLVERILDSAERGARLTSDMLAFARKTQREDAPFSLHEVVERVCEAVRDSQAKASRVVVALDLVAPWVSGDQQQLHQALLNLCLNGLDAMDTPGVLTVGTLVEGDVVRLTVRDTGVGMAPEIRERVFEPFFTTKSPGRGTGLGLSMVYGIVRDHGGRISIESEVGEGTSVVVVLPLTVPPGPAAASVSERVRTPFDGSRVLLVDDDESVREVMRGHLETRGFAVTEAENGREALERLDEGTFELIILDMVMPVMGGAETYAEVRRRLPSQRILIYSGHSREDDVAPLRDHPQTAYLRKPFGHDALLQCMGELLTER